ncbi:hypothetical protein D3C78_1602670 [compost metagenome]
MKLGQSSKHIGGEQIAHLAERPLQQRLNNLELFALLPHKAQIAFSIAGKMPLNLRHHSLTVTRCFKGNIAELKPVHGI